jgi:acetate kinase
MTTRRILIVNPGSSSLKLGVVRVRGTEPEELSETSSETSSGDVSGGAPGGPLGGAGPAGGGRTARPEPGCEESEGRAEVDLVARAASVDAVGVRIVHGGPRLREPALVDAAVRAEIAAHAHLAPLHVPPALQAVDRLQAAYPHLPVVACFDTGFHRTLPPEAALYALPAEWTDSDGPPFRLGFHGLSHAWAARRARDLLAATHPVDRIVTCHLGGGASLAAVLSGRSVDTTMGFTPMDGLVMATRSGSVDPGIIFWAARARGLSLAEIETALDRSAGLAGLAGVPGGDMRQVLSAVARGDRRAGQALDVYVHRLRAAIGAMVAALDGLDVLVFTGGVGENAAEVRRRTVAGLGFLGVALDRRRNEAPGGEDRRIDSEESAVAICRIHAREDLEIARETASVL